jgi:hypothetical protein
VVPGFIVDDVDVMHAVLQAQCLGRDLQWPVITPRREPDLDRRKHDPAGPPGRRAPRHHLLAPAPAGARLGVGTTFPVLLPLLRDQPDDDFDAVEVRAGQLAN